MPLLELQLDHDHLLNQASERIGAPVRAVRLQPSLERQLLRRLKTVERLGTDGPYPILAVHAGRYGHSLQYGLEIYQLDLAGQPILLVRVRAPIAHPNCDALYDFWAVPVEHLKPFFRFVRSLRRAANLTAQAPLLQPAQRDRLWQHTIHFLQRRTEVLQSYGVTPQRGLLLLGEPGNGKTMACRWLEAECHRVGLLWRTMTLDEFRIAMFTRRSDPFDLPTPGIILFDDFDACVQEEHQSHRSELQVSFLSQLDGVRTPTPTVLLFTSNSRFEDFDPAFTRPGRIDHVIHFPQPDAQLRRRLMTERWHPELSAALDLDQVIEATAGLSFAELEEVKRLLVLHYLDHHRWDWQAAWQAYSERGQAARDSAHESSGS